MCRVWRGRRLRRRKEVPFDSPSGAAMPEHLHAFTLAEDGEWGRRWLAYSHGTVTDKSGRLGFNGNV